MICETVSGSLGKQLMTCAYMISCLILVYLLLLIRVWFVYY